MDIPTVNVEEKSAVQTLGPTKRMIIIILKKKKEIDLKSLAEELKMSKMGILKHVNKLEELGMVQRMFIKEGVGRPRLYLRLSEKAAELFPTSYAEIAISMLKYIRDNYGREEVIKALDNRTKNITERYSTLIQKDMPLKKRVELVTQFRDRDGYMAEFTVSRSEFQILEYNCPLLDVAAEYSEACEIERRMFEEILGAKVSSSHQIVSGDKVCRFVIG